MKVVIIGAGEVGYFLAKRLISEGHDVTIIENNPERHRRALETLDASVILGNGVSVAAQLQAEVDKSDVLLSVSGMDETNILCSMIAKRLGVKKCVARVRNEEFSKPGTRITPDTFNIDLMIHPEQTAAYEIVRLIERSSALKIADFDEGNLQIMALQVKNDSPIIDRSIQEVMVANSQIEFLCLCIYRDAKTIIPHGHNIYRSGDVVYFIAPKEDIPEVSKVVGYHEREQQNVMIVGAGQLGKLVASQLSNEVNVKLIEQDLETAETVSAYLNDTLVLHGDGTDVDLLASERIQNMDCFVAVSGSEKTNLLSGLLARYMGVKRVIIHLTTNEYIPIMNRIGMDAVVSKNITTVNAIMKYIRRGNVIAVSLFEDIDAEAIELEPKEKSLITSRPLQDLKLPADMIIGAVIRAGAITIPHGDTRIEVGDRVVVFIKPSMISKVEKYFN
jgi:trk system potassium uptake protein TrkA